MPKPIIAVDIDDVLFPFMPEIIKHYNELKAANLKPEDFHSYHLIEVWGGTEDEATAFVRRVHQSDMLLIPPIAGAKEVLDYLASRYELHIVTSRPVLVETQTKAWLNHYFPDMFKRIDLIGNHYDGVATHTKAEVCEEIGAAYLIDDQPRYIEECAQEGITGVLFGNYAWNKQFKLPSNVTRCLDWPAVRAFFEKETDHA